MSIRSYISYKFSDSIDISSDVSDTLIALRELNSDNGGAYSEEELKSMAEEGKAVLNNMIAFIDNEYAGKNSVVSDLVQKFEEEEMKSQEEVREELVNAREAIEEENWSEALETFEKLEDYSGNLSDSNISSFMGM